MGLLSYEPKPAPMLNQNETISPEKKSNWFSQLTYGWTFSLLKIGYSRPLELTDLWRLEDKRQTRYLSDVLGHNFYEKYAYVDKDFHGFSTESGSVRSSSSDTVDETLNDKGTTTANPNEKRSHARDLEPMTSRADLPGPSEHNAKEASVRQAEKTFVPSTDRWKWVLTLFKKGDSSLTPEDHEKAAVRARSKRLFWAALKTVRKELILAFLARLANRGLQISMSVVTKELIRYVTESHRWHDASDSERVNLRTPRSVGVGFGLAIGLAAMQCVVMVSGALYAFRSTLAGSLLRIAVIDQISRKGMKLSTRARVKQTSGRLTTAVSGDAGFLDIGAYSIIDIVVEPIAILAGCALLIYNLKYSALVGVGILFASSPILAVMMNQLIGSRQEQMKLIDKRLRLLNEIFKAIRQIKLYAYESFFGERIIQVREKELSALKKNVWNRSLVLTVMTFLPTLAAVMTFITYGLIGNTLEPAVIFAAFQLFNVIQAPLQNLPASFANLTDAWVALGRLSDILLAEEYPEEIVNDPQSKYAIRMHGNFSYETAGPSNDNKAKEAAGKDRKAIKAEKKRKATAEKAAKLRAKEGLPPLNSDDTKDTTSSRAPFALLDVDLAIPRGALVCVVGRIGCGKSALLQGMIGELRRTSGEVQLGGSLSYVAQQAWIQNATLRENITFADEIADEDKLSRSISACALSKDLEQLHDGLDTEIGERGINLSGGQKARIALARAVYHDADITLLDSPLAAVDSHVSAYLIENCLLGRSAFGDKTRILVTHHLEVLPHADMILVMEEGRIVQQGTYAELLKSPGLMQSLIQEYGNEDSTDDEDKGGKTLARTSEDPEEVDQNDDKNHAPNTKLIMDEERNTGSIGWMIYLAYARVMSREWWFTISIIALILGQAASVLNTLFLGYWSGQTISGFRQGDYMALYATFGAVNALCVLISSFAIFIAGIRASFIMFDSALKSVLRSPISFHDATPVGRIIHRLTKDVEKLDDRLTYQWYFVLVNFAAVIGTIFLVAFIYPILTIIFLPLLVIYVAIGKFFSRSSREIKRLDSLQRSFIYSAFGEQLGGLSTIRAFGLQEHFLRRLQGTADRQMRSEYLIIATRRWLVLRLDSLGAVLVLGVGLFGVGFRNSVDPIKLGVVLTYALRTVLVFGMMVHYAVQVEQEMNTAERVLHYIDLEHEAPPRLTSDPPADWPQKGHVAFHDVRMRYRPDLPLVLKGLTFEAQPGEKIGIVGRTGAGKSSLAQTLFRIVELAGGQIEIDGYDLRNIGLDTLRSQLSALPQDTLLFSGTMRENLDPTGIKTDHELNDVLQRCGLVPTAGQIQAGSDVERYRKFQLDSVVNDDGDNFSGGERQLVALCRALVKNSHVLLLDEATSSVDPETDAIIQDCIRKEFSHTTLLCIAHRLATIAFYDKVLVMDAGEIAEFDHPLALFDKPDSIFRSMCDAAKLSREAILRIRAGESISAVEGVSQPGTTGMDMEKADMPSGEEKAVEIADKADEAQDLIATVPTGDQGTIGVKE